MGVVMMAAAELGSGFGWRPWNLGFRHVILIVIGVDEALDDAEQIEGAARQPVSPRHRHHVAGASLPSILSSSRRSARAPVTFSR